MEQINARILRVYIYILFYNKIWKLNFNSPVYHFLRLQQFVQKPYFVDQCQCIIWYIICKNNVFKQFIQIYQKNNEFKKYENFGMKYRFVEREKYFESKTSLKSLNRLLGKNKRIKKNKNKGKKITFIFRIVWAVDLFFKRPIWWVHECNQFSLFSIG